MNELGVEIDSLAFWVCGEKSTLLSFETETGESYIDENPRFPASGYPCPIEIIVYARGRQLVLQADTFDCYECDNAKYYILRDSRAIFQTHGALEE